MDSFNVKLLLASDFGLNEVSDTISWFNSTPVEKLLLDEVREKVKDLTQYQFMIPHGIGKPNKLYRVRKSGAEPFLHTDDLKYPPQAITPKGRMNHLNQPLFYASSSQSCAFAESRLKQSEWFHITTYEPKSVLPMRVIGDVSNIRNGVPPIINNASYIHAYQYILNDLPSDTKNAVYLVDAFFSDWLSRVGEEYYKITAIIANELMQQHQCDGLIYPSVQHKGGVNYAIKASVYDCKITPSHTQLCMSGKHYGYEVRDVWVSQTSEPIGISTRVDWPSDEVALPPT